MQVGRSSVHVEWPYYDDNIPIEHDDDINVKNDYNYGK
jgi:hypothetical protein